MRTQLADQNGRFPTKRDRNFTRKSLLELLVRRKLCRFYETKTRCPPLGDILQLFPKPSPTSGVCERRWQSRPGSVLGLYVGLSPCQKEGVSHWETDRCSPNINEPERPRMALEPRIFFVPNLGTFSS